MQKLSALQYFVRKLESKVDRSMNNISPAETIGGHFSLTT